MKMRRISDEQLAIAAALLVLFTAMLEPLVSALLAAAFLAVLIACGLQRPRAS